jgi:hypothetical protein
MFLAGLPGPAAELGLGTVVATAQLKLKAALPPALRVRAARIQERFHLDAPGWYHDGDDSPHLAAVADAVWSQRAMQVRYRLPDLMREAVVRAAASGSHGPDGWVRARIPTGSRRRPGRWPRCTGVDSRRLRRRRSA